MSENNPHNYCRSCRQDFSSTSLFDQHRVGKHEYTYSDGLDMEPPQEDGRRCLEITEMEAKGWALDNRSCWSNPAANARVAARFKALAA